MKFEHLLKIYWSRGLYFNGRLYKLDWTLREMFNNLAGFGKPTRQNFIKRFEARFFLCHPTHKNYSFLHMTGDQKKIINMYVAQLINTSNDIYNLTRLNLVRLYLIKSFRGRAQMLGKPSRGQRTWSNAWTAYKYNKILKIFVNQVIKNNKISKKPEKIDYKRVKRKLRKRDVKIKMQITNIKPDIWF